MAGPGLAAIRAGVEPFQSELTEEFYQNYAGLKDSMSTEPIYSRHAYLFSEASMYAVGSALDEREGSEDVRWLRYLRTFVTMGHIDNSVKLLADRATTFEAQAVVQFEGESIPYRSIGNRIRSEPCRGRRAALFDAKLAETDKLNEILLERMAALHDLSQALGFKSYTDMCTSLKGIDYKTLEETMEEVLRRTEKLYDDSMDEALRSRTGASLTEAWSYDVPFAFRGEEYDTHFPKERLVETFFATLRNMGLVPEEFANIRIDLEERPNKAPRAFCSPIRVPDDIRLVLMPVGGWRDFETMLHEGGHAWHFGCTDPRLPAEYRYLGDNSVTESFAFLLGYLSSDRLWLEKVLGMKDAGEYIRFTLINKLMFIRRYAAKLSYELKLHSSRASAAFSSVYRNSLQRALGFRHTERHYLEDVDDAFYSAEYLRAWILEGQIKEAMTEEFGEEWFLAKKAGDRLRELWSYGQKYTADELVKTIGFVDLDSEPMLREIEQGLNL